MAAEVLVNATSKNFIRRPSLSAQLSNGSTGSLLSTSSAASSAATSPVPPGGLHAPDDGHSHSPSPVPGSGFSPQPPRRDSLMGIEEEFDIDDNPFTWQLTFNARYFEPHEIRVALSGSGNELVIHARRGTGSRGKAALADREYCKKFILPDGVNTKELKCELSANRVLIVEAPKRGADLRRESVHCIPIHPTSELISKFQSIAETEE